MKQVEIIRGQGNLLEAEVDALVNTVNTVGVMGKGIALQFKQAFPDNFVAYAKACKQGVVEPGKMFVFVRDSLMSPRFIINFPTKRHWKGDSKMEDIEAGLEDLVRIIQECNIRSIAIPPLGSGLGGLNWVEVRKRILDAVARLDGVTVHLYEPGGAPPPEDMPVQTKRPAMTDKVAALLHVFRRYRVPGYRLSRIEAQKLAYFLQAADVPLQLQFEAYTYGPYADKLNHWLQNLEGHYIRGYGDKTRDSSMIVLDEAVPLIEERLAEHVDIRRGADRVAELIEGFESPYGLELLATVHWLVNVQGVPLDDHEAVIEAVKGWNARKARVFQDDHIRVAALNLTQWSNIQSG